ncbi:hypothetical protein GOP47_0011901 [Adiantum capillus-veneris]|uniref:Tf2-1-like SH3-like domain-containing protein n=1 Tax=Adiantum capillus-veneris TaxID=13818 RepID=A0A9D4UTN0_ADICA|nr:hypothetical protein GOP47_0011901 [Adiantum capillus-veneris]
MQVAESVHVCVFEWLGVLDICWAIAKLEKSYYGPFQILNPINAMDYQLKLPNHWLIHNSFHVSLLKPYKGEPPSEPIIEDPPKIKDQEEVLQPEAILWHEDKVLKHGKIILLEMLDGCKEYSLRIV